MTQGFYEIISNVTIAKDIYEMVLGGDTSAITAPGQFINIKIEGFYLRRPISICDWDDKTITILFKTVGAGTYKLSEMKAGEKLDILVGLGNGFDPDACGEKPLLVGGGIGTPPMYGLCKKLLAMGKKPSVILGFASQADVVYEEKFKELGVETRIATVDGSYGTKGFVTNAMDALDYDYFYACGPIPMLHALCDATNTSGEVSFEERMGCGFGACMGCTCKTKYGNKRICRDGPVLKKEEVIW
ncbi:MAG: dihydroorotate dehydrogenase electron transfer subunit [Clostridia bacterium]|nr:dihydroorotate dehydrogenase electron transfer subunit [Clostridia bacterium]